MKTTVVHTKRSKRSGAAAVEFAVCLPFLMAITFGSIETTNLIFVQRSLVHAAYEAGNVASSIGGTSAVASTRAQGVATLLGINAVTVSITPSVTTNTPAGTEITVLCSTTIASNSVTGWCLGNRTLTAKYRVIHI